MRKVILNNGAEFEADWCGAANGALHVDVIGDQTIPELTAAFSDPEATAHIVFEYGEMADTFDGYTHLSRVAEGAWRDGATLVTLTKGE